MARRLQPINYELKYLKILSFLQYNYPEAYNELKEEESWEDNDEEEED